MERAIITISESGTVNIPSNSVWMSEMELVELFGVIAPNNSTLARHNSRIHREERLIMKKFIYGVLVLVVVVGVFLLSFYKIYPIKLKTMKIKNCLDMLKKK
jgi:hypothetical protein